MGRAVWLETQDADKDHAGAIALSPATGVPNVTIADEGAMRNETRTGDSDSIGEIPLIVDAEREAGGKIQKHRQRRKPNESTGSRARGKRRLYQKLKTKRSTAPLDSAWAI